MHECRVQKLWAFRSVLCTELGAGKLQRHGGADALVAELVNDGDADIENILLEGRPVVHLLVDDHGQIFERPCDISLGDDADQDERAVAVWLFDPRDCGFTFTAESEMDHGASANQKGGHDKNMLHGCDPSLNSRILLRRAARSGNGTVLQ